MLLKAAAPEVPVSVFEYSHRGSSAESIYTYCARTDESGLAAEQEVKALFEQILRRSAPDHILERLNA